MRLKQLKSRKQPVFDRQVYRFKASFFRTFSSFTFMTALSIFIAGICSPTISITTDKDSWLLLIGLTYLSIFAVIYPCFALGLVDIVVSPTGINVSNPWGQRTRIDWQDIPIVENYSFGARCLVVKSTFHRNRVIYFTSHLYDLPRMLDRVRELAGAEHPLTLALEQEASLPR